MSAEVRSCGPDRAPRVLVVAPGGRGGVASAVRAVAPCLPEVEIVGTRPLGGALAAVGRRPVEVVWLHPSLGWRALLRDTGLAAAARASGRAVVVAVHGWDPRVAERLERFAPRRAARAPAAFGVLTEAHAEALAGFGVERARIYRVANAYRPEIVPETLHPTDPPTVLFVGRLEAGKGARLLVEAIARLPGVRLLLAGDGAVRGAIAARVAGLGLGDRVRLAGWLDGAALRRAYASASVLALPSARESFPLAVVEALAAGIPVVATDTGAISGLIGSAGRLVVREPDAIAAAIGAVLAAPPPVGEARARIRERCAPEAVALAWRGIFREVVGR